MEILFILTQIVLLVSFILVKKTEKESWVYSGRTYCCINNFGYFGGADYSGFDWLYR